MSAPRPAKPEEVPKYDPRKDPNSQSRLLGGVQVPFQLTNQLRWVHREGRYILQQMWERTVSRATLALKPKSGPTVAQVWIDVPQGEE